jgi:DNA-binding transcriptional regulator GbsR (MarR family)
MGQHMLGWGIPRNTGRIWAYLLLQPAPSTLDAIASDLEIAKSGASVAARQLVSFGLARALGQRGSRRVLYEALHNLEAIFAARNAQARTLMDRFREGAAVAPKSRQRQLQEMVEMLEDFLELPPAFIQRIRQRRDP